VTKRPKKSTGLTTTVPEYGVVAQALDEFKHRYGDLVFDCSTKAGDKDARRARQDLKEFQTQLEKARVAKKAPLLESIREIDAEAKRIDKVLEDLKAPIHAQIRAEEDRAERERQAKVEAERIRVETIEQRITDIRSAWRLPVFSTIPELQQALLAVESTVIDDSFAEFQLDAETAKEEAADALRQAIARAAELKAEREQAAREREELEALRAEAAKLREAAARTVVVETPAGLAVTRELAPEAPKPAPVPTRVSPLASTPAPATSAPTPILDVLRDALGYITSVKPPNGLNGRRAQLMAALESAILREEKATCLPR